MSDQDDRREAKTDPVGTAPPVSTDSVPPLHAIPPQANMMQPQPDPNCYADYVLSQLLERSRELEARENALDLGGLLDRQSERLLKETNANYDGLRSGMSALQKSVDALVTRIGNTENALDAGVKHFARIDSDMAEIKEELANLKRELARVLGEIASAAAPEPTAQNS